VSTDASTVRWPVGLCESHPSYPLPPLLPPEPPLPPPAGLPLDPPAPSDGNGLGSGPGDEAIKSGAGTTSPSPYGACRKGCSRSLTQAAAQGDMEVREGGKGRRTGDPFSRLFLSGPFVKA
jgi:hypothetical protein